VLTSLNLAANNLGQLVLPEGWSGPNDDGEYEDPDGEYHQQAPAGSKPEGIIALANAIPDMRTILSVNLLKNKIGSDQAKDLVIILKEHPTLKSLCGNKGNETELDMSGKMGGAEDAIMLAAEVVDNGALSKLIFGGDKYYGDSGPVTPEPATLELGMPEVNLSNKGLQTAGAIIVAAWISHRDKALSSLNLSNNMLGGRPEFSDGSGFVADSSGKCTAHKPASIKMCFLQALSFLLMP
jgi:hypothetical protein